MRLHSSVLRKNITVFQVQFFVASVCVVQLLQAVHIPDVDFPGELPLSEESPAYNPCVHTLPSLYDAIKFSGYLGFVYGAVYWAIYLAVCGDVRGAVRRAVCVAACGAVLGTVCGAVRGAFYGVLYDPVFEAVVGPLYGALYVLFMGLYLRLYMRLYYVPTYSFDRPRYAH